MLKNAFGGYIGTFNAESLSVGSKGDTKDEAAKMRHALLLRFCRILCSNEVKMDRDLDGNAVKKFASGGDQLVGRTHGGGGKDVGLEVPFTPHFTPFCMLNDIPNITPMDPGVINRATYIEFSFVFVKVEDVERAPHYKALDPELDKIIKTKSFIEGFIHILLDGYKDYLKNGMPEFDEEVKDKWTEGNKQGNKVIDAINIMFDITNNDEDTVDVKVMRNFQKKCTDLSTISITRLNEILRGELQLKEGKSGNNRFWKGIKLRRGNGDLFD
jgi:phage/plasmid-associated DNA primase